MKRHGGLFASDKEKWIVYHPITEEQKIPPQKKHKRLRWHIRLRPPQDRTDAIYDVLPNPRRRTGKPKTQRNR